MHLFGQPAPLDPLLELARRHEIPLIEDAAQAIGAVYRGRPVGGIGEIGCFSFYPTKNLGGMGDGGMLTTNDSAVADNLRLFAAHGMRPRYYHSVIGINSRLDTFQAVALRIKLQHLPRWNAARAARAQRYDRWFQESGVVGKIDLPAVDTADESVWNQYTIRVHGGRRDGLREHLKSRGIATEIYYPVPLHEQACFRGGNVRWNELVETERAAREVLSLPVSPLLSESGQREVVAEIVEFLDGTAARRESA